MSRYSSLCTAIQLLESVRKIVVDKTEVNQIIADLQDIAKDARYGGQWHGDGESIADALENCAQKQMECGRCPYKDYRGKGCASMLKKDAARTIRAMGKNSEEKKEKKE